MYGAADSPPPLDAGNSRLRSLVYQLRTEGAGPGRDGLAVGVGVFIGCLPVYGLHLAICWLAGWLLRLNRLKIYLAANISNPFVAPFLLFAEIQAGAYVRRGDLHALSIDAVRTTNPWTFGADLAIGSVVVGAVLGGATGLLTWLATRGAGGDPVFATLVRHASDRYIAISITAWEFARAKMRGDPLYRTVLRDRCVLPSGGTLVDVGCGQGLMLALLAEAARQRQAHPIGAPAFDALVGIETRARIAAIARRALGGDATIVEADARQTPPIACRAVLFCDVLHMMPSSDQQALFRVMTRGLEADGVVVVREANAAAGWRFAMVRAGNRLKALALGRWSETLHFRSASEWRAFFEAEGFNVRMRDAGEGTPFANVLFVLNRRAPASA
jgi:SAM-dependent methyltransferase